MPAGTTVTVIVVPARGPRFEVQSGPLTPIGGGLLTAVAEGVLLPPGKNEIQLRANWAP